MTQFNNCFCNVCGLPMYKDKPIRGSNFCCEECKRINSIPLRPRKEGMVLDHIQRDNFRGRPTCFSTTKWPAPRVALQSYAPAKTLRIKGGQVKRVTTKVLQK